MNKVILFTWCIVFSCTIFGQDNPNKTQLSSSEIKASKLRADGIERCSTTEGLIRRLQDPEYNAYSKNVRTIIDARSALLPCDQSNSVIIPVAVHYDPSFNCDDISCLIDAATAQIASLNADFAALNSDLVSYQNVLASCGGGADVSSTGSCISFCLATQNHPAASGIPDGQPAITVGYSTGGLNNGGTAAPDWPGYLNLFVVNGTMSGVADGIPGALNGDGVTCTADVFGGPGFTPCTSGNTLNNDAFWNLGRTMTHEVGHYLGLYHVWGDVNGGGCGGDDMISDTPDQANPSSGCTTNCATLAACNAGEFVQYNFMDYFDDACLVMFSEEQASVMNTFANNAAWVTGTGCSDGSETSLAACSINASFGPADGSNIVICLDNGNTLNLLDMSTNGISSWDWTFEVTSGDLVLGSTSDNIQNPSIMFTSGTSGTIDVTLEVCDAANVCSMITQSYSISLVSGADCPNDCAFTLNLTDSFGDGWNGATVEILENGVSAGVFGAGFIAGSTDGPYIINLEDGATIDIIQTNGTFPGEEGYTLVDPFGFNVAELVNGTPLTQSFTASCAMPACDDGIQNGDETGVDCGGPNCQDCCSNGIQDADETGIDCGGIDCAPCPACMTGEEEIINENFDSCVLPTGWTVTSTDGGLADITFNGAPNEVPGGAVGPPAEFAGCIAIINDDANDAIGVGCILTPVIDLSGYIQSSLTFDWQHEAVVGGGDFLVQVWDGVAWVTVFSADDDSNGNNQTVDLDTYINPNFQIQFCYDDEGGFQWGAGIDNIQLCGMINDECPTAISTNDISGSYCDGSTESIMATPSNSNVTYAWSSTNTNIVIDDPSIAVTTITMTAPNPCQIEAADISLLATCNLDGTVLFNGIVSSVSVYPTPPSDLTTLVILNENSCGEPVLVDPDCANFITLTADAGNPSFPVDPGDSGTASYTISYAAPAGAPDCCSIDPGVSTDLIVDGSFEAGPGSGAWVEASLNFGTPICSEVDCGLGTGTGPSDGSFWAWFGGIPLPETGSVCQNITIPAVVSSLTLSFDLETIVCDSPSDFLQVTIDGATQVFFVDGSSTGCGVLGYSNQSIDLLAAGVAPGTTVTLCFESETFAVNGNGTNFFVDNVQVNAGETPSTDLCQASISAAYNCQDFITCPPDQNVTCGSAAIAGMVAIDTICSLDDFIIDIQGPDINGQVNCPGTTYTYTYIVSDQCNNVDTCQQVFTIENMGPNIDDCPVDQTVACFLDIELGTPGFTTSCSLEASFDVEGPVITGDPNCPGTVYTYTYTVTDECGRTDDCVQNFTIGFGADPVITCPAGEVVACFDNIEVGIPTVETDCEVGFQVSNSSPVIDGTPNCPGTSYTYTITVTDGCDRSSSCEQVFTIANEEPLIICAENQSVTCESEILPSQPEVTTSCSVDYTITKTGPEIDGDPYCDGTSYTYTYTVTDACGRTASCEQVFTIENTCNRLDFCAFPAATIITDQYPGVTISTQDNHNRPAMIFDTGNPTGNDFDIGTPNELYGGPGIGQGFGNDSFQCNALIISKDRHIPNETEGTLIFDFDCSVFIRTIDLIDMECAYNTITLYDRDLQVIEVINIYQYGENSFHVEDIYQGGVYKMVVDFPCAGGAISDLKYCEDMSPGAMCGLCDRATLDFYEHGVEWQLDALAGNYMIDYQTFDINITDPDGIFIDSHEDISGIEIGVDPIDTDDQLIITYDLAEVASFVEFDIEDLDFKDGASKQQEQVCICGFLNGGQDPIFPTIVSLDGNVEVVGNCANATADSNVSHKDESVLITFTECVDQIVIKYGTGPDSPTSTPSYGKMIIGKRLGFTTESCPGACTDCVLFGDFDNDGVCDDCDICMTGDDNMDADNDGIPDACDADCMGTGMEGDDDLDGVCNADDICPEGNDNIDEDGNGVPDACEECDEYKLVFGCTNEWQQDANNGSFTVVDQTFDINIMDMDNILEDTDQDGFGLNIGIEPVDVDDVVIIKYNLSQVANNVMFDIVDLDYKDGNSKQQEAVCIYGFLDTSQVMILPVITSLDGSVSILGNCAEGTVNSAHSHQDESIMVVFNECVDQIVIEYGTGTNSPIADPDYSNITIGLDLGFKTEVCEHLCLPECENTMRLAGMQSADKHFEAKIDIESTQTINAASIMYDAGDNIKLNPGFVIMNGSVFEAIIDGCDN